MSPAELSMTSAGQDFEDACRREWDVVILGAGVAGAFAAIQLTERGHSVLLVDKRESFPRFKVCGGCLNGQSLSLLRSAGLSETIDRLHGQPLDRLAWITAQRQAEVSLPVGLAVSRSSLDHSLIEVAQTRGAKLLLGVRAQNLATDPDRVTLHLSHNGRELSLTSRIVINATGLATQAGLNSETREEKISRHSHVGAGVVLNHVPEGFRPGTIYMACHAQGYVGLTVVEGGRFNLAAALDPDFVKSQHGLGAAASKLLDACGVSPIDDLPEAPWRGTPLLTRRRCRVAGHRLFVIGDAAGYVEPFTGEGMSWAFRSAALVVPFVERGLTQWDSQLAPRWSRIYQSRLGRKKWVCKGLTTTLRSPWLTRNLIRTVNRYPSLAQTVVRWLNSPDSTSLVSVGLNPSIPLPPSQ